MSATLFYMLAIAAGVTFGWQPDSGGRDGDVEYIVQVTPDAVAQLDQRRDLTSTIPRQLRGHVSKIVIRVGTESPPRKTPASLQEWASKSTRDQPYVARRGGFAVPSGLGGLPSGLGGLPSGPGGQAAGAGNPLREAATRAGQQAIDQVRDEAKSQLQNTGSAFSKTLGAMAGSAIDEGIRRAGPLSDGPSTTRTNERLKWTGGNAPQPTTSASNLRMPDSSVSNRASDQLRMSSDQNQMRSPALPADPANARDSGRLGSGRLGSGTLGQNANRIGAAARTASTRGAATQRSLGGFAQDTLRNPNLASSQTTGNAASTNNPSATGRRVPDAWEDAFGVGVVVEDRYFDVNGKPMNTALVRQQIKLAKIKEQKRLDDVAAENARSANSLAGDDVFAGQSRTRDTLQPGYAGDSRLVDHSQRQTDSPYRDDAGLLDPNDPSGFRDVSGQIRNAPGQMLGSRFGDGRTDDQDRLGLNRRDPRTGRDDYRTGRDDYRTVRDDYRTVRDDYRTGRNDYGDRRDDYPAGRDDRSRDSRSSMDWPRDLERQREEDRQRERHRERWREEDRQVKLGDGTARTASFGGTRRGENIVSASDLDPNDLAANNLGSSGSDPTGSRNRQRSGDLDALDGTSLGRPAIHTTSPLVNGILLVSAIANCYLFIWLRNIRVRYRDLVASKSSRSVAVVD